jgi:hypothetical protein
MRFAGPATFLTAPERFGAAVDASAEATNIARYAYFAAVHLKDNDA